MHWARRTKTCLKVGQLINRIALTGASGFIGQALYSDIIKRKVFIKAFVRSRRQLLRSSEKSDIFIIRDIGSDTLWTPALVNLECIIHTAARAHVMNENEPDALAAYRAVNVKGTLNLARQAADCGVRRFIFLSSIKVNGEMTLPGACFNADDIRQPADAYGMSKMEAEQGLFEIARETGMEVVCIRPPLVYGPGVKGKFLSMLRWLEWGIPLPLGSIHNQRSFVGTDNLVDLIITCMDHPAAANQTFLVSDGEDLSTRVLLQRMTSALRKSARLIPVPAALLTLAARAIGKKDVAQSLLGNLQVDISKTRKLLDWSPPVSVDGRLKKNRRMVFTKAMRRFLDIFFATFGLVILSPLLLLILFLGWLDTGSPLFRQQRVGRFQKPFVLVKFRTMRVDTASVASHLADASAITPLGRFLRHTKLDELPQLWNVLMGDMSLVGPRPSLFNQQILIQERAKRDVYDVRPGITGLAQTQGVDMSTPRLLAETDARMLAALTLRHYFRYLFLTIAGKGSGDCVKEKK